MHLTDHQFVDMVRAILGMRPLFAAWNEPRSAYGGYERLQRLMVAADPDCKRCGGSGYYNAWANDETCPCTGLITPRRGGKRSSAGQAFVVTRSKR